MSRLNNVLVIGAGVGGLAAAAGFAQQGLNVTVLERRSQGDHLGVGINQPANALRVLRLLGVLDPLVEAGFVYDRLQFFDREGGHVVDAPSSLGGDVPANCALSRASLSAALRDAALKAGATIFHDCEVSALRQERDLVFAQGREDLGGFDLAIAFDGMNSTIRRQLFGDRFRPAFTGHAVWRVTVPRPQSVTCCQLFHGIETKAGLIPISDEEMYLFLVSREPGNPRHDPLRFLTLLKERLGEFGGMIGDLRDALTSQDAIVYSPLSEVLIDGDWHKGRIVVAGDAAHLSAPHLTQGAAMALEDAALLIDLVMRDLPIERSLSEFAARRVPRVSLVQKVSGQILRTEMSVEEAGYAESLVALKGIPAALKGVEAVLNRPY